MLQLFAANTGVYLMRFDDWLPLSLSIVVLWYCVGLLHAVQKHGLDPSLLTHITPLSLYRLWTGRLLLLATFLWCLTSPYGVLAASILALFALVHTILLVVFGRGATQPLLYYVSIVFVSILLGTGLTWFVIAACILVVAQEIYLHRWRATYVSRYNAWVAKEARQLHASYHILARTMSKREWFYVLHFAVTESIARPRFSRWLERLYFYLRRPAVISTGIMQVGAPRPLTDAESMQQGSQIVTDALAHMPLDLTDPYDQLRWLARTYNGSTTYSTYLQATYTGVVLAWQDIEKDLS